MKISRRKIIICNPHGNKTMVDNTILKEFLETSPNDKYYTYSGNTDLDLGLYYIGIVTIIINVFNKDLDIISKIFAVLLGLSLFKIIYEFIINIFQFKFKATWFRIIIPIIIAIMWYIYQTRFLYV